MDMKCIYGLGIMVCLLSCSPAGSNRKESTLSSGTHSVTSSLGGKVTIKPYAGPDSIAQQQFLYFHLSLIPAAGVEIQKSKENNYYADFEIQQHLQLMQGADTLSPVICQRVPALHANQFEYEVVFDRMAKGPATFLLYEDKLGIGQAAISFTETELN